MRNKMSNEIVVQDDFAKSLLEIEQTQKMCQQLMKTPHYAKLGADGIFAIVSKARSLGMSEIEALNGGLYYLQGKVGMPAETMAALIRQKSHSIVKDKTSSDSVCILHGRRADNGDTWTIKFSLDDAKRAGLLKNSYEKYPAAMLYNRAMSFMARQLFPDVIRGAGYTLEELKEIASSKNESHYEEVKVEDVKPLYITQEQATEIRQIIDNCDEEYRKQFFSTLKKLFQADDIEQIPENAYERILKGAMNRVQENAKKKQEEFKAAMDGEVTEEVKE